LAKEKITKLQNQFVAGDSETDYVGVLDFHCTPPLESTQNTRFPLLLPEYAHSCD
jgi:hypothetical protein